MGFIAKLKKNKKIKGGEILSIMLAAEGVEKIFGIIDGTYFGFYSTMGVHDIDLVTPRHETSAVHMAGAYARLTGKLGVCMASNGPGVANVLPGVAVENAEGNRVLLITSSRRTPIVYPDRGGTFQYFPQVDVIGPMAKWSCSVPSVDRVAEIMRRALRKCYTGRPGVVHVDIPEDIFNGTFAPEPSWFREPAKYRSLTPLHPAPDQVDEAVRMLTRAKHPLIHAGSGIVHAGAESQVRRLAELLEAPLTTSWAARACQDERRPQAVPMVYIDAIAKARNDADMVLALGTRLGETDWWGKAPYWARPEDQELIQVDIDLEFLGNIRPADLPIQADVKVFLDQLIERLERTPQSTAALSERRRHLGEIKDACRIRREQLDESYDDDCVPMHTSRVLEAVQKEFPEDAIMVVDGGNTAVWSNFYHEIRVPGTVVTTPKMGMLGAGVAQTLGAQVAHPDRRVYCVIGDGAMGFHMQEIESAVRNNLPVIYLVLCDRQWGMVKMNQQFGLRPVKTLLLRSLGPDETINADLGEIEFDKLGAAMGAHGERVSDPKDLAGAIQRSLASGKAAVIHVDVDPVKHMWAPNLKTFADMHQEPEG